MYTSALPHEKYVKCFKCFMMLTPRCKFKFSIAVWRVDSAPLATVAVAILSPSNSCWPSPLSSMSSSPLWSVLSPSSFDFFFSLEDGILSTISWSCWLKVNIKQCTKWSTKQCTQWITNIQNDALKMYIVKKNDALSNVQNDALNNVWN